MMDIITGRAPPPARAESHLSKGSRVDLDGRHPFPAAACVDGGGGGAIRADNPCGLLIETGSRKDGRWRSRKMVGNFSPCFFVFILLRADAIRAQTCEISL